MLMEEEIEMLMYYYLLFDFDFVFPFLVLLTSWLYHIDSELSNSRTF